MRRERAWRESRPGARSRRQGHSSSSTCRRFITGNARSRCADDIAVSSALSLSRSVTCVCVCVSRSGRSRCLTRSRTAIARCNLPRARGVYYRARVRYYNASVASATETADSVYLVRAHLLGRVFTYNQNHLF